MPQESKNWKYKVIKPRKLWTQIGLPLALYSQRLRPKVFFTPSHYAPRFSPVPTAISIMDVAYLRFPELFTKHDLYQLTNWTKYSVRQAKRIFTISESSKNDIINQYHISPEKVVVTYPGIKILKRKNKNENMEELKKKFNISRNYVLFVGTLQPRKNVARLIDAFAKLRNEDLDLVLVGKKGWLYEEILEAPKKFNVADKVKFLDFVSDEDLPGLYQNALVYVLPSLYEGFGLPVLEAMKYGCPVITSNISSLPEAGGDAAVYVDPTDSNDIAKKIEEVISNESLRESMIEKGYMQIKKFDWKKTAGQTLEVLEEIANK